MTTNEDSPDSASGTVKNYYDDFEVMGTIDYSGDFTNAHVSTYKKNGVGWVKDEEVILHDTDCSPEPCFDRIYAHDGPYTPGPKAIKVEDASETYPDGTVRYYHMDHRQALDYPEVCLSCFFFQTNLMRVFVHQ